MPDLKPANENPWYVLATLYGEQDGEEIDWDLHEKNRRAWNAWAGQRLTSQEIENLAQRGSVSENEFRSWQRLGGEIEKIHEQEMQRRNCSDFVYPGFPSRFREISLEKLNCDKVFTVQGFVFPTKFSAGGSVFALEVYFDHCTFYDSTKFSGAKFEYICRFSEALFKGDTFFVNVEFENSVDFRAVVFNEGAYFLDTVFKSNVGFRFSFFSNLSIFILSISSEGEVSSLQFSKTQPFLVIRHLANMHFSRKQRIVVKPNL